MPRQTIAAQLLPGSLDINGAILTWTTSVPADDHQTPSTGREVLLCWNTSTDTAYAVIVTSVADPNTGRVGDHTVSIPFGEMRMFGMYPQRGWSNAGQLQFEAVNAAVRFAVVRI